MRRAMRVVTVAAAMAGWVACSNHSADPAPAPVLSIKSFDVAESGWGDAPLAVHYVWSIDSNTGRALTCKLDLDGDGTFDKEVTDCKGDTTADAPAGLPTFTFTATGEHAPRLVVTDGERTAEATQKIFANHLDFAPTTVFPEKLDGFVSAAVTPMTRVVLTFSSAAKLPTIAPGAILWGTSGRGYLLKVAKATPSGATLTLDGTPSKIQDAVQNGFFGARDVAAPLKDARCVDPRCGLTFTAVDRAPAGAGSTTLGGKSFAQRRDALKLGGSGNFGLKINIPSEEGIEQSIFVGLFVREFVLEVSWFKLKRATIDMRPGFQYEFNLLLKDFTKEWRLGEIELGTIPIGPIIVTPMVLPTVRIQAALKFGATVGLQLPFVVKYEDGWKTSITPELTSAIAEGFDPFQVTAGASASATFIPKVDALVLGLAGPYVGPTATLTLEAKLQTAPASDVAKCGSPVQLCFAGKVGAGGEYGAELPWIDGANVHNNFTLAEQAFYEKCLGKPDAEGNCPDAGPREDAVATTDSAPSDAISTDASSTDGTPETCPTEAGAPPGTPECAKCEHDTCVSGTALAPTCTPCAKKVCDADSYCCTQAWTLSCMQQANTLCGAGCTI